MQFNWIKSFFVAALMSAATNVYAQNNSVAYTRHEVQAGETLYSLSRQYGVSVESIIKANPGSENTIVAGQYLYIPKKGTAAAATTPTKPVTPTAKPATPVTPVTPAKPATPVAPAKPATPVAPAKPATPVVPAKPVTTVTPAKPATPTPSKCKLEIVVEKKTTVYSICKQYDITEQELILANPNLDSSKLKKGEIICIPYSAAEKAEMKRQQEERVRAEAEQKKFQSISVGVILPLGLDQQNKSQEALKMIDFYEGFLLSVNQMKERGISVDVHTYDESSTQTNINGILAQPALKECNMIIGPMKVDNIAAVKNFCKNNGITLVVPFSARENITTGAKNVFQVNPPQTSIYNKVFAEFVNTYKNANIIFVTQTDKTDKQDYTDLFKAYLNKAGVKFKTIAADDNEVMAGAMSETLQNVIIPSASGVQPFEKLALQMEAMENTNITLFGHPEWQNLSVKNKAVLAKYQATIFATFYQDDTNADTRAFESRFQRWFKREQLKSFPKFGPIGYDIGMYFIKGINDYRSTFVEKVGLVSSKAIQNPMTFVPTEGNNGYINNAVLLVRYRTDGSTTSKLF